MRAANVRRISRPQTNHSHLICMRAANPRRMLNTIYKRVAAYLLKSGVAILGLNKISNFKTSNFTSGDPKKLNVLADLCFSLDYIV
jgi:hypothetical protein